MLKSVINSSLIVFVIKNIDIVDYLVREYEKVFNDKREFKEEKELLNLWLDALFCLFKYEENQPCISVKERK